MKSEYEKMGIDYDVIKPMLSLANYQALIMSKKDLIN